MKHLFVINTHSFVDLITNSSSELFICDTKKTADMVEALLHKLLDNHSEMLNAPNHYSFSECFSPVRVAEFSFDLDKFPSGLGAKYLSYDEYRDYGNHSPHPESYYAAQNAEKKLQAVHPYYQTQWNPYEKLSESEKAEQEKQWRDYLSKQSVLWNDFGAEKLQVEMELFVAFLTENGFSKKEIETVKKVNKKLLRERKSGKYSHIYYQEGELPKSILEAYDFFSECLSWKLRVVKGNILVRSASDNTVPYELFDVIGNYLHARRYHLG